MRKLFIYPNCSKGGVISVIRGRARAEKDTEFDVVFFNDRGGRNAFSDLDNVNIRLVRQDRSQNYFAYLTQHFTYDQVNVLSHPKTANLLSANDDLAVTYEFHSSDMSIVKKEIGELNLDRLAAITAPTPQMVKAITNFMPARIKPRMSVVPNLVDTALFNEQSPTDFFTNSKFELDSQTIPMVWVGRFDKGKGYGYALRTLAQLPEKYFCFFVVSLESNPERANQFYREAAEMGVLHRVRLFIDLPQSAMAELLSSTRQRRGWLMSTSLMESFGYSVAEALACGLRVAAFELPVWVNFERQDLLHRVTSGDVQGLAQAITSSQ